MQSDYEAFVANIVDTDCRRHVAIYHAVRNIPYGATGERDPLSVLRNRRGSCSGKHLLLRNLLRADGYEAEVITIYTHVNKALPVRPGLPVKLTQLIENEVVSDFHHFVRVRVDGQWLNLDATWHDALRDYGFPVNADWDGSGDTIIAAEALEEYPAVEDLAAFKQNLIDSLPRHEREKREQFFTELTRWMEMEISPTRREDPE